PRQRWPFGLIAVHRGPEGAFAFAFVAFVAFGDAFGVAAGVAAGAVAACSCMSVSKRWAIASMSSGESAMDVERVMMGLRGLPARVPCRPSAALRTTANSMRCRFGVTQ